MAQILIFTLFVFTVVYCNAIKIPLIGTDTALFDKFEKSFNKKFSNPSERVKRLGIFAKNVAQIKMLNLLHPETEFGITEYSDLTTEEFQSRLMAADWEDKFAAAMNISNNGQNDETQKRYKRATAPANYDFRNAQKVTAVRNQGSCGCCWSFATVAAIEVQYALKYNQLIGLSEQQLLDCDNVNGGCNGGYPYYSMQYAITNGLKQQYYYPYLGYKSTCQSSTASGFITYLRTFTQLPADENYLVDYIYNYGAVTMCFTFPSTMQHYVSGIVSITASQCEAQKSGAHAVTLIGFGVENNVPYFTAKNSWGTNWGEAGFFRFRRNQNFCSFTANLVAPVF
jgi:C1A family cysteine protease